ATRTWRRWRRGSERPHVRVCRTSSWAKRKRASSARSPSGGGEVVRGDYQVRALSLVDGVQECVSAEFGKGLKHLEAEVATDDRCVSKRRPAVFAHALEAP